MLEKLRDFRKATSSHSKALELLLSEKKKAYLKKKKIT